MKVGDRVLVRDLLPIHGGPTGVIVAPWSDDGCKWYVETDVAPDREKYSAYYAGTVGWLVSASGLEVISNDAGLTAMQQTLETIRQKI